MAALIFREFARLIEANQKELNLGEVVNLVKQLEQAGYIFNISRGINNEVNLNPERPGIIYLFRRIIATFTKKRLKLTHWQLYAYKYKVHYNYKRTLNWPGWVIRAVRFKPKMALPRDDYFYANRPDWVISAIKFWKNKQRC